MGKLYWRLEAPIDHPADALAYFRFQRVAQLKKQIDEYDGHVQDWTHQREFLEKLREINAGIFEPGSDETDSVVPTLTERIAEAEIDRAEALAQADLAFREFAEVEMRLFDFTCEALRLECLLTDPALAEDIPLPTLLSQLSTLVSLNNHRTDLFIQLAKGLGYDEELGPRREDSDISLRADAELKMYRGIRIGNRIFCYMESSAVRRFIASCHGLPDTRLLL